MTHTQTTQAFKKEVEASSKITQLTLVAVILSIFILSDQKGGDIITKYISIAFVMIVMFTWLSSKKGRMVYIGAELVWLYVWCLYAMFISIYAIDSKASFSRIITMIQIGVLITCSNNAIVWSKNVRFFMYIFVIAAILSYLIPFTPLSGIMIEQIAGIKKARVTGVFNDANYFGTALVRAQFISLYLLSISRSNHERILLLAGVIFFAVGIVLTGSRSALIGMISTILFAGWAFRVYSLQNHPIRVAMALFLMVTFIAITYSKISNNPRLLDRYIHTAKVIDEADLAQEGKSHSLRGRFELLTLAWRMAIEHPFGIGLNNFGYYADKFAHSNYFELLACTGFPGLLIFYSIYMALFLKAFRLPSKAFGAEEARRLMLTFPLVLAVLDVGLVNYYSKDFWLSVSLFASNLALASQKKSNQLINQY